MQANSMPKSIGKFEIERELGLGRDQGGMGRVFRAHLSGQRSVALKVARDRRVAALINEAEILSQLKHPNIARILPLKLQGKTIFYQKEHIEGEPRFLMALELVEGRSVTGMGRLGPGQVARVIQEVASGLDYAHRRRVAHLDVKPANILVSSDLKRVVLIDWGTAEAIGSGKPRETQGRFYTPEYVSPERVEGSPPDVRNDVYSLGVTAYELLVGAVPYKKTTARETARAHISDPLPEEPLKKLPPAVQAVLRKAMAKKPADRYASAGALAADLARVLPKEGRQRLIGAPAAALISLVLILAIGYAVYALMSKGGSPTTTTYPPGGTGAANPKLTQSAPVAVSPTPAATDTPVVQSTLEPTRTPVPPTNTPAPTSTPVPTDTPSPTSTTAPTDTPTAPRTPSSAVSPGPRPSTTASASP